MTHNNDNDRDRWLGHSLYVQELERIARWNEKAAVVIAVVAMVLIFLIITAILGAHVASVVFAALAISVALLMTQWDGK